MKTKINMNIKGLFRDGSTIFGMYLAFLLLGYLFLDKGFGYLGIGPIYVSEIGVLIIGISFFISLAKRRIRWRVILQPTAIALIAFIGWGFFRTIPYLANYGSMALRDAVLWAYAVFAIAASTLFPTGFIDKALTIYKKISPVFLVWLPIGFTVFWLILLPRQETLYFPFLVLRAAPICVHLAGIGSYILLRMDQREASGYSKVLQWVMWVLWWVAWVLFSVISRSGMLSALLGLGLTVILKPRIKISVPLLSGVAVALFLIVFSINIPVPDPSRNVSVSAQQISINLISLAGTKNPASQKLIEWSSLLTRNNRPQTSAPVDDNNRPQTSAPVDEANLRYDTMGWRLSWWKEIAKYTLGGQYFWLGKGYGINLADADGFQVMPDHSLRSPHNATMNMLARSGVPGLLLWLGFIVSFATQILMVIFNKRDKNLSLIALWIFIYWIVFLFNSSFDVFLEGPMGGIWFWSITGFGLLIMEKSRHTVIDEK